MKTPEEWISVYADKVVNSPFAISPKWLIQQVRLEALKESAEIVNTLSRGTKSKHRSYAIDECRDAILARAEELNEQPQEG